MLAGLLRDLLAPPTCLVCGVPADALCGSCRRALPWLGALRCTRCGLPGRCDPGGRGSRACPAAGLAFDAAWAAVVHEGPARELVAALKFRRARAAVGPMAAALARAPVLHGGGAVLVPVPTSPARVRERGFDQAMLLARGVAARGAHDDPEAATPRAPVVRALLERRDAPGTRGRRQVGATRRERLAPGRLDLRVVRRAGRLPERCVLVDDVHTTGATLHACALALKAAGVREVVALTYARALP